MGLNSPIITVIVRLFQSYAMEGRADEVVKVRHLPGYEALLRELHTKAKSCHTKETA